MLMIAWSAGKFKFRLICSLSMFCIKDEETMQTSIRDIQFSFFLNVVPSKTLSSR